MLGALSLYNITSFCFHNFDRSYIAFTNITLMNPENVGQHISLHHSHIWRKPLIYEKTFPDSSICHLQLNQMGTSGQLWRQRNAHKYRSGGHSKGKILPSSRTTASGVDSQRYNLDEDAYVKSRQLVESMLEMKRLKLTEGGKFTLAAYPGVGKLNFVINDYHPKVANPNYSRNIKGKHFTS